MQAARDRALPGSDSATSRCRLRAPALFDNAVESCGTGRRSITRSPRPRLTDISTAQRDLPDHAGPDQADSGVIDGAPCCFGLTGVEVGVQQVTSLLAAAARVRDLPAAGLGQKSFPLRCWTIGGITAGNWCALEESCERRERAVSSWLASGMQRNSSSHVHQIAAVSGAQSSARAGARAARERRPLRCADPLEVIEFLGLSSR